MKRFFCLLVGLSIAYMSCSNPADTNDNEDKQYVYTGKIIAENVSIGTIDTTIIYKVRLVHGSTLDTIRDTVIISSDKISEYIALKFHKVYSVDTLSQIDHRIYSAPTFATISWERPIKDSDWLAEITFEPLPDAYGVLISTDDPAVTAWFGDHAEVQLGSLVAIDSLNNVPDTTLLRKGLGSAYNFSYVLTFNKIDNL